MRLAIMQPYIFPYIGYFQLIKAVDKFVVYDNIKFTKKGWIQRNRILVNGKDDYISLQIKKDSDFLNVSERYLADSFQDEKEKILRRIKEAYRKAPSFEFVYSMIENCLNCSDVNLFNYIFNSIKTICEFLNLNTELIISSTIEIDHSLKSQDKVLSICRKFNSSEYINPIGGVELYSKDEFLKEKVKLYFLKPRLVEYKQFQKDFVPWLSIIDVLMFNTRAEVLQMLDSYDLM